jgi:hypothetical protein
MVTAVPIERYRQERLKLASIADLDRRIHKATADLETMREKHAQVRTELHQKEFEASQELTRLHGARADAAWAKSRVGQMELDYPELREVAHVETD